MIYYHEALYGKQYSKGAPIISFPGYSSKH